MPKDANGLLTNSISKTRPGFARATIPDDMEKKFHEIVLTLIQMGYYFNREWTLNTKSHKLENKEIEFKGKPYMALKIDGLLWNWAESELDDVLAEIKEM